MLQCEIKIVHRSGNILKLRVHAYEVWRNSSLGNKSFRITVKWVLLKSHSIEQRNIFILEVLKVMILYVNKL